MKEEIVRKQRSYFIQLDELEQNLLKQLNNAGDDILSNITLVNNLEDSKRISDDVKEKVREGKITEENIEIFSEK